VLTDAMQLWKNSSKEMRTREMRTREVCYWKE
jgi:hypothetical protein